jgi:hypothetical protein
MLAVQAKWAFQSRNIESIGNMTAIRSLKDAHDIWESLTCLGKTQDLITP